VDSNVIMREDKSFAYDLNVQRGIVSSRVALLLRSAEIKPQLSDLFVFTTQSPLRKYLVVARYALEEIKIYFFVISSGLHKL